MDCRVAYFSFEEKEKMLLPRISGTGAMTILFIFLQKYFSLKDSDQATGSESGTGSMTQAAN